MSAEGIPERDQTAAFDTLVREFAPAVFTVCLAYTRNAHDAEDLVQETLLKASRSIGDLRDPDAVRPWLLQIARRLCTNHYNRKRTAEALPEDVPDPKRESDSDLEQLRAVLAKIPRDYRDAITLFYLDEMSCAKVGEALGISEGAVRVRLNRGRFMLHQLLKEDNL